MAEDVLNVANLMVFKQKHFSQLLLSYIYCDYTVCNNGIFNCCLMLISRVVAVVCFEPYTINMLLY